MREDFFMKLQAGSEIIDNIEFNILNWFVLAGITSVPTNYYYETCID